MDKIHLWGTLPPRFSEAFSRLSPILQFAQAADGCSIEVVKARGVLVEKHDGMIRLGWCKPVQLYRALSLLRQDWEQTEIYRQEVPCFETGMMFDVSRNAVLLPQTLETLLCRMALMGMDVGMMYTEDTYEVPQEPYFGYMRGRYSMEELRHLDDWADALGVELIPCIQTLGHLNRVLHWPAMSRYADNGEVLLADDEETYALLERMITAAAAPYRSKRIHVGMDEAHGIGLGAHLRKHGFENPHTIIHRHLLRVKQITDQLGLKPMMWSDMYFRPDSPTGAYYDSEPSDAAISSVVPGVELFYWDYYHNTEEEYAQMLEKHRRLTDTLLFAGGIWTFTGPAPDYEKTITTTVAALSACKKAGVSFVLATAWGDNGAEANLLTALPGMQLFAEFAYTGTYDPAQLAQRFCVCCQGDIAPFLALSQFNTVSGMHPTALRPVNAAKFLLYQDPFVQLFAKDTEGLSMEIHFRRLEEYFTMWAARGDIYAELMEFYAHLADVLANKCRWHENIRNAVAQEDRLTALALAEILPALEQQVQQLRRMWCNLWMRTNKPYGFEVIDGRLGAICARLDTAHTRMSAWIAKDGAETLPELREEVLPYTQRAGGTLFGSYAVSEIVSACKIDL